MPKRIHKTTLATTDIASLARYFLADAGLEVALRFVDQAELAFGQLATMPEIGAHLGFRQPRYADIRRWHIDGFPRLIILYRVISDGIDIVRVLDGGRDMDSPFLPTGRVNPYFSSSSLIHLGASASVPTGCLQAPLRSVAVATAIAPSTPLSQIQG